MIYQFEPTIHDREDIYDLYDYLHENKDKIEFGVWPPLNQLIVQVGEETHALPLASTLKPEDIQARYSLAFGYHCHARGLDESIFASRQERLDFMFEDKLPPAAEGLTHEKVNDYREAAQAAISKVEESVVKEAITRILNEVEEHIESAHENSMEADYEPFRIDS